MRRLVAALDQPLRQVEIFATVVDAQTGTLREWALDLSIGSGRARAQSALRGASTATLEPATVLWSSVALDLRLRALESEGKARIVSRPSAFSEAAAHTPRAVRVDVLSPVPISPLQ